MPGDVPLQPDAAAPRGLAPVRQLPAERLLLQCADDRAAPTRSGLAGEGKCMFYRIVLQGHAQQMGTLDEVMRQFSYVTGLPPSVTATLFGTAPTVIKQQVAAADAERISMTLRAIGANVTVEPLLHAPVPVGLDPVTLPGLPMPSAAIELPPPPAPEQAARAPAEQRKPRWAKALLAILIAAGALLVAHEYQETLRAVRTTPIQAPVVMKPADPSPEAPAFLSAHIVGPWRCTDQNTGGAAHWEYAEDGTLSYFGDEFSRSDKPLMRPGLPTAWALEANRLTMRYDAAPSRTVTLDTLSLSKLDYRDSKGDETRCRRP